MSGIRQRPLPGAGDMAGGGVQAAREAVGTAAGGRGPAAAATAILSGDLTLGLWIYWVSSLRILCGQGQRSLDSAELSVNSRVSTGVI